MKVIDPVLMETPFCANHCILEGFDDADKADEYEKKFGPTIAEVLPIMHITELRVLEYRKEDGSFIVAMPEASDAIEKVKASSKASDEKAKVSSHNCGWDLSLPIQFFYLQKAAELQEQIRKLQEEAASLDAE